LQKPPKIILGIDPGTLIMGYGILEVNGSRVVMRDMQVLRLSGKKDNHQRLQLIHEKVEELIRIYKPDEFALKHPSLEKMYKAC
jgi:crossover junction endodeoxyribonuclease RuvC